MANNRLIFMVNDTDPKATYTLYDVNRNVDVNMHSPTIQPWLKFSLWNDLQTTLFMILGIKINGGFDGQAEYLFINPVTTQSLIAGLDSGNYQAELFLSYNTIWVTTVAVDTLGVFTTDGDHNFATGDKIWLSNTSEIPELAVTEWTITAIANNQFTIQEEWTYPESITVFAGSVQAFNVTITETSTHVAPVILKGDLA